ncbi:hypothetical protein CfE428DRAFT_4768 [Chthoniobacter flavus Ellin428]|uniref:Uncharacterized protein n=1 Tax=Chthoniobacter flavus Ellin428 TaxID=497964 RepID=B4D778_9BACT|nr:Imm21 family immunity protein [Chthoniobacter flavus]EDY17729.1 hypothetical protein CfE428DRAFT_4768 [Chthoniobacter flavus Ellin428]TCO87054.1 immunity protein 21 of polymorphic toxin system [Chthoniobacter flavus]
MATLPYVSSEGGPLLVADADALRAWSGAFDDGEDYTRACSALGSGGLASLDGRALVWDIQGGGTAYLTRSDEQSFQLVRFWANAELDDAAIQDCIRLIKPAGEASTVQITAPLAIVVWACEDTRTMAIKSCPGVPEGDWSMGGTVYCFPVKAGTYLAETGSFESADCSAVSLTCTLST